jgi:transposase
MPKRIQLRRFRRGEKRWLLSKIRERKLPVWIAQRYRVIALVYAGRSVLAAARGLACAKETAYRWVEEFNRFGFRHFSRSSNPAGRPSQLTKRQLQLLYHIAQKRPTDVGLPFTNWSMTKLQAYLVKRRSFPKVSPEWLRRLLRRAHISWQRTKTWKQSHDPHFQAKKSVFWPYTPSGPRTAWSCAMINSGRWNSVLSQAGAGPSIDIRSVIGPRTRGSAALNSCTASMMFTPTAWSAVSVSERPPKILGPVSSDCESVIRYKSAFTS